MKTTAPLSPRFLTTKELAAELRMTPNAVRNMRHRGQGPVGVRVGKSVLYASAEVEKRLAARAAADPLAQRCAGGSA